MQIRVMLTLIAILGKHLLLVERNICCLVLILDTRCSDARMLECGFLDFVFWDLLFAYSLLLS
jgi:hypothetical protein